MRIATFNCNSIRTRLDTVLRWCAEQRPDVLCLQETKVQDPDFPLAPLVDAGYRAAFAGMKSYNGVAILSRGELGNIEFGLSSDPRDPFRLASATANGVSIVNTYVPQGRDIEHPMYRYKLEWFHRLRRYFDERFSPDDAVVWLGDLNVAAEPMDVHSPENYAHHVCFHAAAREAFRHCRAWGFVDVFRLFHPEPGHYTFFDYRTSFRGADARGWRIDYILASSSLARRARASWIDLEPRKRPRPSDHTFVVADFD